MNSITMNNVTSGNTGSSTTQQFGLLANTIGASQMNITSTGSNFTSNNVGFQSATLSGSVLNASFTGGSMSNNFADAVVGVVSDANSVATLTFSGVTADNSGS